MEEEDCSSAEYFHRRWVPLQHTSLLRPPCSPYRKFVTDLHNKQDLTIAIEKGDVDRVRSYRVWWNVRLCTNTPPHSRYGELYTALQFALVNRKDTLASCLLVDPSINVFTTSSPSNLTSLMIAAYYNNTLGITSQLLQRVKLGGFRALNAVDSQGRTALDFAVPGGPVYMLLRRHGVLHAKELSVTEQARNILEGEAWLRSTKGSSSGRSRNASLNSAKADFAGAAREKEVDWEMQLELWKASSFSDIRREGKSATALSAEKAETGAAPTENTRGKH